MIPDDSVPRLVLRAGEADPVPPDRGNKVKGLKLRLKSLKDKVRLSNQHLGLKSELQTRIGASELSLSFKSGFRF